MWSVAGISMSPGGVWISSVRGAFKKKGRIPGKVGWDIQKDTSPTKVDVPRRTSCSQYPRSGGQMTSRNVRRASIYRIVE